MIKRIKQITKDGSYTLIDPEKNVSFHSIHGALQESRHVYIQAGLDYCLDTFSDAKEVFILEAGFGTGLNAILTAIKALETKQQIFYSTIESYPLIKEEWEVLEYDQMLDYKGTGELFEAIHNADWNKEVEIHPNFFLTKFKMNIQDFIPTQNYNLIYYDAFAPSAQPELWTKEIFSTLSACLIPQGSLVTFCSKSIVRTAMKEAGFNVTKLPGPPGKREMVRALKY